MDLEGTTLTQNVDWFLQGWAGKIPVWTTDGKQVGYRIGYDKFDIYLLPEFVGKISKNTPLISKNGLGWDITLVYGGGNDTNATAPSQQVVVGPTGTVVNAPVATGISAQVQTLSLGNIKLTVPVLIAGGALALYMFGRMGRR